MFSNGFINLSEVLFQTPFSIEKCTNAFVFVIAIKSPNCWRISITVLFWAAESDISVLYDSKKKTQSSTLNYTFK